MEEIINQIISLLEKLKEANKEPKKELKDVTLRYGMVVTTASIKNGRITFVPKVGQTALSLDDRKAETIEGLANCMLQAVKIAKVANK